MLGSCAIVLKSTAANLFMRGDWRVPLYRFGLKGRELESLLSIRFLLFSLQVEVFDKFCSISELNFEYYRSHFSAHSQNFEIFQAKKRPCFSSKIY